MDKLQPRSQARRRLITAAAASAALNALVPADPAAASAGAARWSTTAAPQALVLSGRVVDAGGRPLAAARITVRSALPASAAGAWPEALRAYSEVFESDPDRHELIGKINNCLLKLGRMTGPAA